LYFCINSHKPFNASKDTLPPNHKLKQVKHYLNYTNPSASPSIIEAYSYTGLFVCGLSAAIVLIERVLGADEDEEAIRIGRRLYTMMRGVLTWSLEEG
jgi:hypothetical protein